MFSMTGYGKGEYREGGIELTVEIKSVNNRYLDLAVRSPRIFAFYEERIRTKVRASLTRGHADIYVSYTDKRELPKAQYVDANAARGWVDAAVRLKAMFPALADDFTVNALMKCPDVVRQEEVQGADEALCAALDAALDAALSDLNGMRAKEGRKLAEDMLSRMDEIGRLRQAIADRAPLVAQGYRAKLEERMREALAGVTGAVIELYDTNGAVGAAKGAGIGAGIYRDAAEAFASLRKIAVIEPDGLKADAYCGAYEVWKERLERVVAGE